MCIYVREGELGETLSGDRSDHFQACLHGKYAELWQESESHDWDQQPEIQEGLRVIFARIFNDLQRHLRDCLFAQAAICTNLCASFPDPPVGHYNCLAS